MRPALPLLLALVCISLVSGPVPASDEVTLNGSFVWSRSDGDRTGDLKAVFTPKGDGEWSVAFHFDWEDGPHVYTGTARGSLSEGSLEGDVDNDSEERQASFRFQGSFENGTFTGTHAHVGKEGELNDTGTLTLGAAK